MGEASVKAGFDGYFYGRAANQELLNHYIDKFGARPGGLGSYAFYINEQAMHEILDKYNFEWRK